MSRKTASILTTLVAAALLIGPQGASRAAGNAYISASGYVNIANIGLVTVNVRASLTSTSAASGTVYISSNSFYMSGSVASITFNASGQAVLTTKGGYVCNFATGSYVPATITVTLQSGGTHGYVGYTTVCAGLAPSLSLTGLQYGSVSIYKW